MPLGTPIANRDRLETEGLIGFFVNTLVMRCDLAGRPSFRELLARVRETTLGAFAHPDLPFERLVEELRPDRDLGRTPLFQVLFAFQSVAAEGRGASELSLEHLPVETGKALFDLTLTLDETPGGSPAPSSTTRTSSMPCACGAWRATWKPCWQPPSGSRTGASPSCRCSPLPSGTSSRRSGRHLPEGAGRPPPARARRGPGGAHSGGHRHRFTARRG